MPWLYIRYAASVSSQLGIHLSVLRVHGLGAVAVLVALSVPVPRLALLELVVRDNAHVLADNKKKYEAKYQIFLTMARKNITCFSMSCKACALRALVHFCLLYLQEFF